MAVHQVVGFDARCGHLGEMVGERPIDVEEIAVARERRLIRTICAWYTHVIVGDMMNKADPLKVLHEALLQIVSVLNRPQGDNLILTRAGVSLDTALFPLLVRVSMQRNLTIGTLADQVGRDYSTVSRQVTRLQTLGLIHTELSETDRRQRLLSVTAMGKNTIKKIDRARKSVMSEVLDGWSQAEITDLARMTTRLAAAMQPRA